MVLATSRKPARPNIRLTILLSAASIAVALDAFSGPPVAQTLTATVIAELQLDDGRPRWARFSPVNPSSILLSVDGRGVLATLPQGTIRQLDEGDLPVGWLNHDVVVRHRGGTLELLNPDEWTRSPPDADPSQLTRSARGETARFSVSDEVRVVDVGGRIVFASEKKVYGLSTSPDGHKLILYFGNTEHLLLDVPTQSTSVLPSQIEAWTWLPDGTTLIGETTEGASVRIEAVARTHLFLYELGGELLSIGLPRPIDNAALRLLDVSAQGHILVDAEQVLPEPAYLGVVVLQLELPPGAKE